MSSFRKVPKLSVLVVGFTQKHRDRGFDPCRSGGQGAHRGHPLATTKARASRVPLDTVRYHLTFYGTHSPVQTLAKPSTVCPVGPFMLYFSGPCRGKCGGGKRFPPSEAVGGCSDFIALLYQDS